MQTLFFDTVVVGSGFAGRTVASYLKPGEYVVLERGEDRDMGEMLTRYQRARLRGLDPLAAEAEAFSSDLPWNRFERLSPYCYSKFAMIRGGASNWWGGKATRFSSEVFADDGLLPWPMTRDAMRPWYERAERRLNISGDPTYPDAPPVGAIEGAGYWRKAFAPYFNPSTIYNVAINKSFPSGSPTGQGFCEGRAHCAVCKEDAKARPDNIFPHQESLYGTLAHQIEFEGSRAVAVECYDGRDLFRIECNRVVIAANGVETPRLLARSDLPSGVNTDSLGLFCQDHAHVEIECHIPKPLPYGALGGLSHVYIPEISKNWPSRFGPIEVSALALTHEPSTTAWTIAARPEILKTRGAAAFRADLQGTFKIFAELEVPAGLRSRIDLTSETAQIIDEHYPELVPAFDQITNDITDQLTARGIQVVRVLPHYRGGYGGHHFVGTTNWSRGPHNMMEDDGRLGGTDNVYIAGASVTPRSGGVAPTLTLMALAERLGHHLAGGDGAPS